jgi:PAS fold
MPREDVSSITVVRLNNLGALTRSKLERDRPNWPQALLAASSRTSHLAISLMDSQTRCNSVNAAGTRETGLKIEGHLGKTPREIVGDLARQVEPVFEEVLRTGKPASSWLAGSVRDSAEFGHWFDYTFPIFDSSHRVQQLGLFTVNMTAEKESAAILAALPNSRFAPASSAELLLRLEEAVQGFYLGLELSLGELCCPSVEMARKVDLFQTKLQRLDNEIRLVRELVYAVLAKFHIPAC